MSSNDEFKKAPPKTAAKAKADKKQVKPVVPSEPSGETSGSCSECSPQAHVRAQAIGKATSPRGDPPKVEEQLW